MLRGFESDQIGVRRHLTRASLEKQVHLPGELAWRRAKKCLAELRAMEIPDQIRSSR